MTPEEMARAGEFWAVLGVIMLVTLGALAWTMFLPVAVKMDKGRWIAGSGLFGQVDRVVYMEPRRFRIWDGSMASGVWFATYDSRQGGVMWDPVGGEYWPGTTFLTERVRLARRAGEYLSDWTGFSRP